MADKRTPIDKKPSWFKMHDSIAPAVKYLPKEIAGEGFQAAMVYYTEGIEPDLSKLNPAAISIYAMLKSWIDEAAFDMQKKADIGRDSAERRWGNRDAIGTYGYPSVAMGTHADKNRKEKKRIDKSGGSGIDTEKERKGVNETTTTNDDLISYARESLNGLNNSLIEQLTAFRASMTDELIQYAIDDASANGHPTFAYTRSILKRYVANGYKTVDDVKTAEEERQRQNKAKPRKPMDERTITNEECEGLYRIPDRKGNPLDNVPFTT